MNIMADTKKTGKFKGKPNKLGHGVPGGVIGNVANHAAWHASWRQEFPRMISEEAMNGFIDAMHDHEPTDKLTFYMSPTMHKRLYILNGLCWFNNHSDRK